MSSYQINHLDQLESEAVFVLREVAAQFDNPVMLFSGGKDSIVMAHLAFKAFHPARLPFPLLHVDTGHNFPETIEYRDQFVAKIGARLIVALVQDSINKGRVVEETGPLASRNSLQTVTLLDALEDQLSALEEDTKPINEDENLDLALHDINLLEDLDSEVEEYIAPVANSGNDITTQSDENGVAMVILDGSETYDPQSRVSSWQWINALGKEVAQSSKVKIKLNKGVHRFELRVKDSEGSWTSDALTVTIE